MKSSKSWRKVRFDSYDRLADLKQLFTNKLNVKHKYDGCGWSYVVQGKE